MPNKLTGLFFGSFNPIHNGHLNIANYLIKERYCSEIWFVVSPQNPLKKSSSLLDEKLRLKLVNKAIKGVEGLKSCDVEFNMVRPSYTIDTLHKLKLDFPNKEFALVIGEDNLLNFKKWKSYEELLSNYVIFVYPRINTTFEENHLNYVDDDYIRKFKVERIKAPLAKVSSTQIRNKILLGDSIDSLVPSSIKSEIIKYYVKY